MDRAKPFSCDAIGGKQRIGSLDVEQPVGMVEWLLAPGRDDRLYPRQRHPQRFAPVRTKLTSRPPHCEHTSRPTQARTGVSAPYFAAIAATSGSVRCRQALHHTISRASAAAVLPKVAGGLE